MANIENAKEPAKKLELKTKFREAAQEKKSTIIMRSISVHILRKCNQKNTIYININ